MFSRPVDNVILVVILLFSILTFVSLSLGDSDEDYTLPIEITGLILLVIFLIEMLLKLYAVGLVSFTQSFLKNLWNDFDLAVVILSLVLAAITLSQGSQGLGLLKFSAVLRLLRLTVAFRKFGDFKRIKAKMLTRRFSADFSVNTASEKVIDILHMVMLEPWISTNHDLQKAVEWCLEVISSHKLDDAIVTFVKGDQIKEQELLNLVNQFSTTPNPNSANYPRRRSSRLSKEPIVFPGPENEMTFDVKQCFNLVDFNDFDIFELKQLTNGNELFTLMHLLFNRKNLFQQLNINVEKFKGLISRIQRGYNNIPYHNCTHAADVTQTLHYFLTSCNAGDLLNIIPLEQAACYLATCVHDFEHPGLNNVYLVNTQSELAIRYNDKSVLENHHVSSSFSVSLTEEYDIYADLAAVDFAKLRAQMIEMVLCTDIVQHFAMLASFKSKFPTSKPILPEDKSICFQLLIHAADISNPSKPWNLCFKWTELVLEEFWGQGDRERAQGLPIGFMNDRFTMNTAKSQVGFIDVIVWPTFETLKVEFPAVMENCTNLQDNRAKWEKRKDKYDEELRALNNPAPSPK